MGCEIIDQMGEVESELGCPHFGERASWEFRTEDLIDLHLSCPENPTQAPIDQLSR